MQNTHVSNWRSLCSYTGN